MNRWLDLYSSHQFRQGCDNLLIDVPVIWVCRMGLEFGGESHVRAGRIDLNTVSHGIRPTTTDQGPERADPLAQ